MARKIGLNSPDYFTLILKGKRPLVAAAAGQLAAVLDLSGKEQRYFLALVAWNQAKTPVEKESSWKKVLVQAPTRSHPLNDAESQIFSNWFVLSLYEMVSLSDFQADPDWIAKKYRRKITAKDAALGLELLEKLALIERTEDPGAFAAARAT